MQLGFDDFTIQTPRGRVHFKDTARAPEVDATARASLEGYFRASAKLNDNMGRCRAPHTQTERFVKREVDKLAPNERPDAARIQQMREAIQPDIDDVLSNRRSDYDETLFGLSNSTGAHLGAFTFTDTHVLGVDRRGVLELQTSPGPLLDLIADDLVAYGEVAAGLIVGLLEEPSFQVAGLDSNVRIKRFYFVDLDISGGIVEATNEIFKTAGLDIVTYPNRPGQRGTLRHKYLSLGEA